MSPTEPVPEIPIDNFAVVWTDPRVNVPVQLEMEKAFPH
jgi:hypothetical protein